MRTEFSNAAIIFIASCALSISATAGNKRSSSAKAEFKLANACPSTGMHKGACPGFVIDHIKPLACGGEDAPGNMQYQTTADAKAKDKWERKGCQ